MMLNDKIKIRPLLGLAIRKESLIKKKSLSFIHKSHKALMLALSVLNIDYGLHQSHI